MTTAPDPEGPRATARSNDDGSAVKRQPLSRLASPDGHIAQLERQLLDACAQDVTLPNAIGRVLSLYRWTSQAHADRLATLKRTGTEPTSSSPALGDESPLTVAVDLAQRQRIRFALVDAVLGVDGPEPIASTVAQLLANLERIRR